MAISQLSWIYGKNFRWESIQRIYMDSLPKSGLICFCGGFLVDWRYFPEVFCYWPGSPASRPEGAFTKASAAPLPGFSVTKAPLSPKHRLQLHQSTSLTKTLASASPKPQPSLRLRVCSSFHIKPHPPCFEALHSSAPPMCVCVNNKDPIWSRSTESSVMPVKFLSRVFRM